MLDNSTHLGNSLRNSCFYITNQTYGTRMAHSYLRLPTNAVLRGHAAACPHAPVVLAAAGHAVPRPASCPDSRCTMKGWRRPLTGTTSLPPVVALGKFDALHKGHQALAIAAAHLGGWPWLVSFAGIAAVLGWPTRLPLVAPCDRDRVLRSWANACLGHAPTECAIPFAEVRAMSPEAFVRMLAEELRVSGVVVGSNYRFGYRAAGDAALLQRLGPQYGMRVRVLDLVGSYSGSLSEGEALREDVLTVSSSRVREGLAAGDLEQVEECLGRPYRLVLDLQEACLTEGPEGLGVRLGSNAYQNQPPGPGRYRVAANWCGPLTGCTLDCSEDGWAEGVLAIDEAGATLSAGATAAEWREKGGLLALDFLSSRAAAGCDIIASS